ncbi:MAG: hypothetical protein COX17_05120 [Deltaproteobacteria bacterium CG23_combo_of_CG06-09_8_20_14_all_60_8]|nr:MAG: hypothetical protein AUK28_04975 [Desulfobacterales bacterium CG2_30_60_27]PIP43781.1 MAG: hypothetical protein COX17_05120 [Deltaproteobacteria bacterium CG23_combo_of_CG06-09_8_20_14_all_60_8]
MDIANVASSFKGLDSVPVVAESLVRQEKEKAPVVTPVTPSNNAEGGSLDQKALLTKQTELSLEETARYVHDVQARLDKMGTNLQFTIDQKTDKIVVEITSKIDGELIRKIPPAQMVELMSKVDAMVGLLFDGQV